MIGRVDLSPQEEVKGVRWKLVLPTCQDCGGWGAAIDAKFVTCETCRGLGLYGFPLPNTTCHRCKGHGSHYDRTCKTCSGSGSSSSYTAKFYVPPGLGRNFYGVVGGLGHAGVGGGPPGDLYLLIL